MERLCMMLGERREVTLSVEIDGSDNFELRNASYSLSRNGEEVDSGTPLVDGHEMRVYVEPPEAGVYRLRVAFGIGGERIVRTVRIDTDE